MAENPYVPQGDPVAQCFAQRFTNLDVFSSAQEIRSTPTLVYVRLVYVVVILIKISISTSTTELGKVIKPDDIKVSLYLEKLLVHLKAVTTLGGKNLHLLGARFLQILTKVKIWFQQQGKKQKPAKEQQRPAAGSETSRTTEMKREDPSQYTDRFNFLTDFSKAPTMNTTVWPNQFQSSNGYFDPNNSLQPSWDDMAFDFPMDLHPTLFTNLMEADQTQNYNDIENSNAEGFNQMDYLHNMPDFGSWPMQ